MITKPQLSNRRRAARAAVVFALLLQASLASAEPKLSAEAEGYFRGGVELLRGQTPNYQDAYEQFKLAYEKSKSWKVLSNLGLCALKLERDGEALAFYEGYLALGGRKVSRTDREAVERHILLARGNAARVEIVASAEGELADVRVASSVAEQRYVLEFGTTTLVVRAGTHTFSARNKSGRTLEWQVTLAPGSTVSHRFDFDVPVRTTKIQRKPAVTEEPAETRPTRSSRHESTLRTVGFVALGTSVVTIGAGGVFAVFAKGHERSALKRCSSDNVCDPSARSDFDSAASQMRVANVLMVSGVVIGVAGLGLVLFGGPGQSETNREQAFRISPMLGKGSAGLVARGHF